jgi:hypothetical protein
MILTPAVNALPAGEQGEPDDLALPDIRERYKDRWVAILVTRRDRNLLPTRGKVVAEDADRYMLRQKLGKYPDICIFFAGEPPYRLLL